MTPTFRRRLLTGLGAAALLGALAWAYRPAAIEVSVSAVERGAVRVVIEEDGVTRIRERYTVTPPVSGYVSRLALHVGDAVGPDQALFTLEPLPAATLDVRARAQAQAAVARAQAAERAASSAASAAQASADFARREVARREPLYRSGAISRTQYEQATAEALRSAATLASARSAIDVARHEREAAAVALRYAAGARADTQRIAVYAPVAGAVLAIHREDEGVVEAGTPMVTVGDPRSLEIVVDVLSADAVRIRPGMTVWLDRWGGDAPLEAHVRQIEPVAFTKISALGVEEQRVRVIADLQAPAERWQRLGDAYRVEAQFVLEDRAEVLRVPHSSLFRSGSDWSVYVVEAGRARLRTVTPGARGLLYSEIVAGLEPGARVITYPDDRIAEGVRVTEHD